MATVDPKRPRLKRDWVGRTVRTNRVLRNGNMTISAGTVAKVAQFYRGLRLEADPCERCGVGVHISRVPENAVDLLAEEGSG